MKKGSPLTDKATPPLARMTSPMFAWTTPMRNAGVSKTASASVTATIMSPPDAVPERWKARSPEILRNCPKLPKKSSAMTTT